jgi:TetR/AcrR family transcriptional regulator
MIYMQSIDEPQSDNPAAQAARKRPKPGERRIQILQTLAEMLQQPSGDRITTAALAARLDVSEAALYRHFASKAQMFEGLIEFIEQSVFTLINQIVAREEATVGDPRAIGVRQASKIVAMLNQFFDKIEATLKQCLRAGVAESASVTPTVDAQVRASVLAAFVAGRLQRFVRSGFKRLPSEHLEPSLSVLLG